MSPVMNTTLAMKGICPEWRNVVGIRYHMLVSTKVDGKWAVTFRVLFCL